jgi:hypothetical protein
MTQLMGDPSTAGCSSGLLVKGGVGASDSQLEAFDGERPAALVEQGFLDRRS